MASCSLLDALSVEMALIDQTVTVRSLFLVLYKTANLVKQQPEQEGDKRNVLKPHAGEDIGREEGRLLPSPISVTNGRQSREVRACRLASCGDGGGSGGNVIEWLLTSPSTRAYEYYRLRAVQRPQALTSAAAAGGGEFHFGFSRRVLALVAFRRVGSCLERRPCAVSLPRNKTDALCGGGKEENGCLVGRCCRRSVAH
uniref:Uncharacterized protein n=1 Tax=Steinernema glaseri TaxID=37863 RepID=A0A1I7ZPX6_9BILA